MDILGSLEVGVQVVKAGQSEDKKSRVCHAVLEPRKAGCSEQSKLQPPGEVKVYNYDDKM